MSVFKIIAVGSQDTVTVYKSNASESAYNAPYGDGVVSAKLKKETNKAASLEFMILPSNDAYSIFEKKKTFVYVTRDGKYIFRGRVSDIKTDIFKQRTITCEGDLAFLQDSVQPPNKKTKTETAGNTKKKKRSLRYITVGGSETSDKNTVKMTVENYFRSLINEHNSQVSGYNKGFTVGTVSVSGKGNTESFERTSYQDTSSLISSDLLSVYGGILRTRYVNNVAYIDWLDSYTESNSQEIKFGVNLIELDEEPPCDEVWSVLLPVGDDNVTIASVNSGSIYLENSTAINKYGRIVHYHKFSNCKDASALKTKAQAYMALHSKIFPDNLIVKAIDLQLIDRYSDPIEIGDNVKVVSSPHGISKTMGCTEMELDLVNPENNSYTIGTIMPPDKEKQKDSLSSKHASSSRSSQNAFNQAGTAMDKMNEDINATANNVNVNAENIAVNAQNIAVNAENIAVVAKNVSIAADTIDVKTNELSIQFGDEMDDLTGHITVTANGIKSTFSNKADGVSSTISQTADTISASVESADGNIRSRITLTKDELTTEFNKKLYGENQDGTGGLYADYSSKITQSATNLTSTFDAKLYGTNGTASNPTGGLVAAYRSEITQSAQSLTSTFDAKLYGSGGTLDSPTGGLVADYKSKISQSATNLTSTFDAKLYGTNGTASNPTGGIVAAYRSEISQSATNLTSTFDAKLYGSGGTASSPTGGIVAAYRSEISQSATNITSSVDGKLYGSGGTASNPTGGIVAAYRSEISQSATSITSTVETNYVGKGKIASTINQTAQEVLIQASKINLSGYTTMTDFNATKGKIDGLVAGTEVATKIVATSAKVATGTFEIGDSNNNAKLKYRGTEYYSLTISMPGVTGSFDALGLTYSNGAYQSSFSLAHSHSVTTNNDGTITIGGSVATNANNRSFKIADTKAYKDGVSAAINSVTVKSLGKNASENITYDSSTNKYTIPLKAILTNDKVGTSSYTFTAPSAYNNGYDDGEASVTISSVNKNTDSSNSYNSSNNQYTIPLKATASNGYTKTGSYTFAATDSYNNGYDDGKDSVTISSVNKNTDSSNSYNSSNNQYTIPLKATASNGYTKTGSYTFTATDSYNNGYSAGEDSVSVNSIACYNSSLNSDNQSQHVEITINLSNGTSPKKWIDIGAWDPYNAGYTAGAASIRPADVTIERVTVFANGNASVRLTVNGYTSSRSVDAANVTDNHT